jgi:hypothetical protein
MKPNAKKSKENYLNHLECDDERILAGHEDRHVGDHLVVQDQHQPEHKEGGILKKNVQIGRTQQRQC